MSFLHVDLQPKTRKQLQDECNVGLKSIFDMHHQK